MTKPSTERQRASRQRLAELCAHPNSVYAIHYACESFAKQTGVGAPRITAVAAINLGTGETHAFSIAAEAELLGLAPVQVLSRFDMLELAMLQNVFLFLERTQMQRFVHWKMRDVTFGFQALEHRFAMLGGHPLRVLESQKTDLSRVVVEIYGSTYVTPATIETLVAKNQLSVAGALWGTSEAEAFERGDYRGVQRSVVAKVAAIAELARRCHDRTLKTDATWWTLNAGNLREAAELFRDNPVKAWTGVFATMVIGVATVLIRVMS